ncbi:MULTISPECIES: DUF7529 family protein [Halolamina]|uniref:Uncharacterized protein n=1 Tax=Halolamina pelagica TaxID=699431 RepID=A0A1I5VWF3_9EURY|nr:MULTISPECIES: hypothetical protein [Halolamina]NHX37525.1 hypothetical protein [Halolamina sp. R1-12]SFQ11822.1 hypothetical protein SAMN05216277_1215 [Halolamina pelagica]
MVRRTEETEERVDSRPSDSDKQGWIATLEELHALAEERRADGWTVLTTQAGDTAPVPPETGDTDRFGLVHVVPGDDADELTELLADGTIDEFEAYRRTVNATCFLITELRDTERRECVLVATAYDLGEADALASHAADVGHIYTRIRRLDGTPVAEIRHEAYEKLLPASTTE